VSDYLTGDEIVSRLNTALSLTTVNIATDPDNQAHYLSEFAMTANDLLTRRDPTKDVAPLAVSDE
jgi:hypothetical protein